MVGKKAIEKDLLSLSNVSKDYPFAKSKAVYSVNNAMFAILDEASKPLRLSLRCDPKLAELLRQKYETVMPGEKLDKRFWNTIVLSGQLSRPEVKDLIRHAYELGLQAEAGRI